MKRKHVLLVVGVLVVLSLLAACQPQTVEVTRVVQETVTEQVEVTRVITETVEVEGEPVEVTRVVEVAAEPEETFPEGTELSILQWSHFVPNYDLWFDQFATEWGDAAGVDVTVDHVNIADVAPSLSAAIDAGEGPTLVELSLGASLFIEGVHDLTDLNMRAQELFGDPAETCVANSYLPATDTWYGYCHGWVPDPGDYDINLWTQAGFPDGPETWQDLLDGGTQIFQQQGVPMGLGLSPEIDSNMAMRAIIWSFGGSIQDENENVTVNSPEVVDAVEFMKKLYESTMTEEVFAWDAASNNQGLIAGQLSYILNSISAWRTAQEANPQVAEDVFFVPALEGPGGQLAAQHVLYNWIVPSFAKNGDAAKEFLLHYTANMPLATYNSKLYDFPAFTDTVPQLEDWLADDPFSTSHKDRLAFLKIDDALKWSTNIGHPGPASTAIGEVFGTFVIPNMMARAARGQQSAQDSVAQAEREIKDIFEKWRQRGLVGGGS
jgi:multiple sugar transport system substrate-binding protein